MIRRALAATAAVALVVLTAAPAAAHTSLKAASPARDSTVDPPARIVLTYTESVIVPRVMVTDAAGRRHEDGPPRAVDGTVTQPVRGTLPPGAYTVAWRVVSGDGHPVTGTYAFTVRGTPGSPPAAAPAGTAPAEQTPAAPSSAGGGGTGRWWPAAAGLAAAAVTAVAVIAMAVVRRGRSTGG